LKVHIVLHTLLTAHNPSLSEYIMPTHTKYIIR
jgi:hypothetical protein